MQILSYLLNMIKVYMKLYLVKLVIYEVIHCRSRYE